MCEVSESPMTIDLVQIFTLVVGGSGIVGWLLTYLQLSEQRKEEARAHLRQIVLTPEFFHFLGTLDFVTLRLDSLKKSKDFAEFKET